MADVAAQADRVLDEDRRRTRGRLAGNPSQHSCQHPKLATGFATMLRVQEMNGVAFSK